MTFQQWINAACKGKVSVALRVIADATGQDLDYAALYRWYTRPTPIPPRCARLIEQASAGVCPFDELIDADFIAEHFEYEDSATAIAQLVSRLASREVEARSVGEQLQRLSERQQRVDAEIERLRARYRALVDNARRRTAAADKPKRKRPSAKRKRSAAA